MEKSDSLTQMGMRGDQIALDFNEGQGQTTIKRKNYSKE